PARAAVHQGWKRGAVAGGFRGVVPVEDEQAAVPGGDAEDDLPGEAAVVLNYRAGQAAEAAGGELDRVRRVAIADQRTHRAERLDLVRFGAVGVVGADE